MRFLLDTGDHQFAPVYPTTSTLAATRHRPWRVDFLIHYIGYLFQLIGNHFMDINARIAARVTALRKECDLSLDALAAKADVSRSMISLIERGQSSATAVVLEKLAAGLGVAL